MMPPKKTTKKKTTQKKPTVPKAKISIPSKKITVSKPTKKSTDQQVHISKKTTKKKTTKKKTVSKPSVSKSTASKSITPKKVIKSTGSWDIQRSVQQKQKAVRVKPIIIIFGPEGVGKSHVLDSGIKVKEKQMKLGKLSTLSPGRIIDCSGKNDIVATKNFKKEFQNGDLMILKAFFRNKLDDNGEPMLDEEGIPIMEYIEDPIERVCNVENLIKESQQFTTGYIGIDELDLVEKDAMAYIYKEYRIYKKEDGTLWYRSKEKFDNKIGQWKTIPEKECRGITPIMYRSRNDRMRDIVRAINAIQIPVVITCHVREKWDDNEPTGLIFPNILQEFRDASAFIVHMELFDDFETIKEHGITKVKEVKGRKIKIFKNGYQNQIEPDLRELKGDAFEMDEIIDFLLKEFDN